MEETNLKDVMQKIHSDIKQFRDHIEEQAKTFDLSGFLQVLNEGVKKESRESAGENKESKDENKSKTLADFCNELNSIFSPNSSSGTSIPVTIDNSNKTHLADLINRLIYNEKEAAIINEEIAKLNSKDKKLFWAMYHGIPLDETSLKLDTVISSLSTLNANIVNNFNYKERLEDILDEIEILRQEIRSKPSTETQ